MLGPNQRHIDPKDDAISNHTPLFQRLALVCIKAYQRHLSPLKGYGCAFRILTGRDSCSAYGYRVIARYGLPVGLVLLRRRLHACSQRNRQYQQYQQHQQHRQNQPRRPHHPSPLHAQAGFCDVPDCDISGCDMPDCDITQCDLPSCGGNGRRCNPCDIIDCCNVPWNRKRERDVDEAWVKRIGTHGVKRPRVRAHIGSAASRRGA